MNHQTPPHNSSSTARLIIIAIAAVGLLLGGFYIWSNRTKPETSSDSMTVNRTAVPVTELPPAVQEEINEVPVDVAPAVENKLIKPVVAAPANIEGSDAAVKLAVADFAPAMAAWIVSDQQIRKWVLAMDLMADGDVSRSYRPLAYPLTRFEPEVRGVEPEQQFVMRVENYQRTDLLIRLLVAIDVDHLAQYYQAWSPLLEKAYQEQGKKDKFNQRLHAALQRVLDARPLASPPLLKKRGGVIYVYADDKLEAASDVEKMLWRMGPDNSLKLQQYLRQLQQRLPKTK